MLNGYLCRQYGLGSKCYSSDVLLSYQDLEETHWVSLAPMNTSSTMGSDRPYDSGRIIYISN